MQNMITEYKLVVVGGKYGLVNVSQHDAIRQFCRGLFIRYICVDKFCMAIPKFKLEGHLRRKFSDL